MRIEKLSDRELEAMIAKAGLPEEVDKVFTVIDGIQAYAERRRRRETKTKVITVDFRGARRDQERFDDIAAMRNIAEQAWERD